MRHLDRLRAVARFPDDGDVLRRVQDEDQSHAHQSFVVDYEHADLLVRRHALILGPSTDTTEPCLEPTTRSACTPRPAFRHWWAGAPHGGSVTSTTKRPSRGPASASPPTRRARSCIPMSP